MLHKIHAVSKPALPLIAYHDFSAFKLYHNDLGLLGAMSKLNAKTLINGSEVFTEFKGELSEQHVFQQFTLNEELSINYYPFENGRYELDFIVQNENDELIRLRFKGLSLSSSATTVEYPIDIGSVFNVKIQHQNNINFISNNF